MLLQQLGVVLNSTVCYLKGDGRFGGGTDRGRGDFSDGADERLRWLRAVVRSLHWLGQEERDTRWQILTQNTRIGVICGFDPCFISFRGRLFFVGGRPVISSELGLVVAIIVGPEVICGSFPSSLVYSLWLWIFAVGALGFPDGDLSVGPWTTR